MTTQDPQNPLVDIRSFIISQISLLGITNNSSDIQSWVQTRGMTALQDIAGNTSVEVAWENPAVRVQMLQLWLHFSDMENTLPSHRKQEEAPYIRLAEKPQYSARSSRIPDFIRESLRLLLPSVCGVVQRYTKEDFKGDIISGLSTGINMAPKALAFAILTGCPAQYGLYSVTYPALLYTVFGSSQHLGTTPSGLLSVLLRAVVTEWCNDPDVFDPPANPTSTDIGNCAQEDYWLVVRQIALLQGALLLVLGLMHGGFLMRFFSRTLMNGFGSAAAVLIAISQINMMLYRKKEYITRPSSRPYDEVYDLVSQLDKIDQTTIIFVLVFAVMMILLKKFKYTKQSYSLIVIALSTLTAMILIKNTDIALDITGDVPRGLPAPSADILDFSRSKITPLMWLEQAAAIALVGFLESSSAAQICSLRYGYKVDMNREMVAIGILNVISSFFFCMPTMGTVSGTACVSAFGGRTVFANGVSGLVNLLTAVALMGLVFYLPKATLGLVIATAVLTLVDYKVIGFLWRGHRRDFWSLMVLFVSTLIVGIDRGLLVALVLNIVSHIYRSGETEVYELGRVGDTTTFQSKKHCQVYVYRGVTILRFNGPLFFGNSALFKEAIMNAIVPTDKSAKPPNIIVLDASAINFVDASGVLLIEEVVVELSTQHIAVMFCHVNTKVWDKLWVNGLLDQIGRDHFYVSIDDAMRAIVQAYKKLDAEDETEDKYLSSFFQTFNTSIARKPKGLVDPSQEAFADDGDLQPHDRKTGTLLEVRATAASRKKNTSTFAQWCPCFLPSTGEERAALISAEPVFLDPEANAHKRDRTD